MDSAILFHIVSLASIVGFSSTYSIPFRRPCKDMSPECLKESVQAVLPAVAKGIPEIGIDSLDPYVMKQLNLKLPGDIDVEFTDGYATGLKHCIVDFARYEENTFETQLHCNLTIKGKYKSSGSLLMFPIDGEGKSSIECNNIKLHSILKLVSIVNSDGQRHLHIKSSNIDHSYDGRVSYSMTNLFKGSPAISQAILNFINSNWKMVADKFGTPIVEYGVNHVMKNLRKIFTVFSIDELRKL